MNHQKKIEKLISQLVLRQTKEADELILEDALATYEKSEINKSAKTSNRRLVMSRITKFAAAIMIIGAILGLSQMGGSFVGANVALADVAKKLQEMQNCVFKKTTTASNEDNTSWKFDSLVYIKKSVMLEEVYGNDKLTGQAYVNFQQGTLVTIDHETKEFKKRALTDEDAEEELAACFSPTDYVNFFLSNGKYRNLGTKEINGVLAEGFEFNDKRGLICMNKKDVESIITRLWVDINTNLPVCMEMEGIINEGNHRINARMIQYDPKWNVDLASDFFEPKIPADYMNSKERGFIGIILKNWPALKVVKGRAAERAGIKDGDIVIKVNDNSDLPETSDEAYNLFRGKIGEKVALTIKRGDQILNYVIEREPAAK